MLRSRALPIKRGSNLKIEKSANQSNKELSQFFSSFFVFLFVLISKIVVYTSNKTETPEKT